MKVLFLFLLSLVCLGCSNREQEKIFQLRNNLLVTPILSSEFDSLIQELKAFPIHQGVEISLKIASRHELTLEVIRKQEQLLLQFYTDASKSDRKRILQQCLALDQKMDQSGCYDAVEKGLKRCELLENNFSLTQKENWEMKKMKVVFFNRQESFKESLSILYQLLDEHRKANEHKLLFQDLCSIANIFTRLGDLQKGLEVYEEAYELAGANNLYEQQQSCFLPIINLLYDLGRYDGVIQYYNKAIIAPQYSICSSIYLVLSQSYLHLHKADSARYYLHEMEKKSDKEASIIFYCHMAETFISECKADSAAYYLKEAFKKTSNYKNREVAIPRYLMPTYATYASLLNKEGRIKQADSVFHLIEPLMKLPVNDPVRQKKQIDALYHYSSFCHSTHQYKKAASLLMYRDSILKVYYESKELRETKNWVERFELQEMTHAYETKKKELNNTSRIAAVSWVFAIVLVFILAIGIFIVSRIYRQKKNKILLLEKKLRELSKSQTVQTPKRTPLSAQEQLYQVAVKTVETQKMFLNETLTLDELAKLLNTNRTSLSACINKYSGSNFNQWINKYRIDYVKKHITPSSNLRQLSAEAGFKSYNTFCSTFKEHTGCTPSEFMREHKYDAY